MKKRILPLFICIITLAALSLAVVGTVRAQDRAVTLTWSVMGAGGMGGSSSGYSLQGTLGQPVAGVADTDTLHLTSGFWGEVWQAVVQLFNYLPLILR